MQGFVCWSKSHKSFYHLLDTSKAIPITVMVVGFLFAQCWPTNDPHDYLKQSII